MRVQRWVYGAALAAAACGVAAAGLASAHAPLARGVSVAREGAAVAVRMPGFGLLVRAPGADDFIYACDALLGLSPETMQAPVAYLAGGDLLVGTPSGVRAFTASGCPATEGERLADVPSAALAIHPSDADRVVAVSAELVPAVYRSDDAGFSFALQGRLDGAGGLVTALLLDPNDPDVVLVSRQGSMAIARSEDSGATFRRVEQEREVVLLHAAAGTPARLWAMARTRGVRGVDILRADRSEGPFAPVLNVNFFGGFAIDAATGAIWVGDEGGGLFRSTDGGDSWQEVDPELAVACLAHAGGGLWACTPGLPTQRALVHLEAGAAEVRDVVAFADVDRLSACAPEVAVETLCAAAWNEWRADVLRATSVEGTAGVGGVSSAGSAGGAGAVDAGGGSTPKAVVATNGCHVARVATAAAAPLWPFALALLWVATTARRSSASRSLRRGALRPAGSARPTPRR